MEYLSINIRSIRRGDLFWESDGGRDALFVAASNAYRDENGIAVEAREIPSGKPQHFFENDRAGGYGPKLYNQPQYSCPDWPALLIGLSKAMLQLQADARLDSEAQLVDLKIIADQHRESCDQWQSKACEAQQEVARLRSLIDSIVDLADRNLNGITMGTRIKHHIATALEAAGRAGG